MTHIESGFDVKLSVIVPMYNVQEDVEACLESIARQTIDSFECILIDDGSLDRTPEIAKAFVAKHENFSYHRIENQGLGHARNYGVQFASGEYLTFPDSDDIVLPHAYEKMYELAVKHDADISIGDVIRFNSKKQYTSTLHRKAFASASEVMHISSNHNLFYDTTAWNKLFKRSFYLKECLKWAEGMLYEDIPVTVPAHFMANKVVYLNETVYCWRSRDGVSQSITQRRTELSNFHDRLKAIRLVDEYFDSNVTDKELHLYKDYKWLSLDLMLYVNSLEAADDDFCIAVCQEIAQYLSRVDERVYAMLPALDRIKYAYIINGDLDGLLDAVHYMRRGRKTLNVRELSGRLIGDFPLGNLNTGLKDVTNEVLNEGVEARIECVSLDKTGLRIDGHMHFKALNNYLPKNVAAEVHLVDQDGNRAQKLSCCFSVEAHMPRVRVSRDYRKVKVESHVADRFCISLRRSDITHLPVGEYHLSVILSQGKWSSEPFLLGRPFAGVNPRPYPLLLGSTGISISYDLNYAILIGIAEGGAEISSLSEIEGLTARCSMLDDSTEDRRLVPTIDELGQETGKLVLDGLSYYCRKPLFFALDSGLTKIIYPTHSGKLGVEFRNDVLPCTASIDGDGSIAIKIDRTISPFDLPGSYEMVLKGERYGQEVVLPVEQSPDEIFGSLNLHDVCFTANLRDDVYRILLNIGSGKGRHVVSLFSAHERGSAAISMDVDGYSYRLMRGEERLKLMVERHKRFLERTAFRKKIVENVLYPAMRLLPIRTNLIVFESYWGRSTACNPGALYGYIDTKYAKYDCVWSLVDPRIAVRGNGRAVTRGTLSYYFALARAKYLINNVNFPDAYQKRRGQIEIQTMHGTPLKTLGLDVPGDFPTQESIDAFLRRCGRWDYLIVQSKAVEEITKSCYAFKKKYLRTGYPRNDELFRKANSETQIKMKEKLGLDPAKKFVLYAPTWRVNGRFDLRLDLKDMQAELGEKFDFGIRVHHLALPGFDPSVLGDEVMDFTHADSLDDLLLAADVLITDYSSLMFDFALLDRPLIFYVYDLEEYRDNLRGFNIDLESEAPGPLLKTSTEVIDKLKLLDIGEFGFEEEYLRFKNKFLTYEQGTASEEVVKQVLLREGN